MTARTTLVLAVLLLVAGPGCKRAPRFKSRSLGAPTSSLRTARALSHLGGSLDDGLSDSYTRAQLEQDLIRQAVAEQSREAVKVERALTEALEATVERHCVAMSTDLLFLEPQGDTLGHLFRSLRQASAPAGVTVPAAGQVMGLSVHVMRFGTDATWCADQDEALVQRVAARAEAPVKSDVTVLGPGAWLVHTRAGRSTPASSSLLAKSFLEGLGVKGELVAFAPTDHAVAYADAASPRALALAAKAVTEALEASGEDGVLQAQPLRFSKGRWTPWQPRAMGVEVSAAVQAAAELETTVASGVVENLVELEQAIALMPSTHRTVAVEAGVATTRRHGAEGRVTVRVELDALEAQVVGQASQVALVDDAGRETTVPWATFAAKAKADLAPVVVDGAPVPRLYRLDAGFRWPVAGSRAGRQAMVVPQRSMD
jgi:hypothetical protein